MAVWRRHSRAQTLGRTGARVALALLAAWMLARLGIRWDYVADSPAQIGDLLGRMFPPDWRFARALLAPLVQTLNIATLGVNATGTPSASWTSVPGSIGVEYQVNSDVLTYAKVAHGFKSGAINLGAVQGEAVKPETVTSFEVGTKISFLDKRASLAAALFTSRYKDMQVVQIGVAPILGNASGAKINGLELEALVKPVPALTLGASIGLMDPKYTEFVNFDERHGVLVDTKGNQLANVSKTQANLNAELVQTFGNYRASFRAEYAWRSKFYFTEFYTEDASQKSYGMVNLSASVRPTNGPWKLYGYVRNANNATALTSMTIASPVLGGARTVNYTPPRYFGVGFTYDF